MSIHSAGGSSFILLCAFIAACGATAPTIPVTGSRSTLELNTAKAEQLENIPGMGPFLLSGSLKERALRPFQGCDDWMRRVRGVGPLAAAKISGLGLRVNGETCR